MSVKIIQERLDGYNAKSFQEEEMALREITQEVALHSLYNTKFYKLAAFHGEHACAYFIPLTGFPKIWILRYCIRIPTSISTLSRPSQT
ncbi:unnamed protein product, partial [marine sediment metagenome]